MKHGAKKRKKKPVLLHYFQEIWDVMKLEAKLKTLLAVLFLPPIVVLNCIVTVLQTQIITVGGRFILLGVLFEKGGIMREK